MNVRALECTSCYGGRALGVRRRQRSRRCRCAGTRWGCLGSRAAGGRCRRALPTRDWGQAGTVLVGHHSRPHPVLPGILLALSAVQPMATSGGDNGCASSREAGDYRGEGAGATPARVPGSEATDPGVRPDLSFIGALTWAFGQVGALSHVGHILLLPASSQLPWKCARVMHRAAPRWWARWLMHRD